MSRIYEQRDFEFISISTDKSGNKERSLEFLKSKQSPGKNYLLTENNKYRLIEPIDQPWQGALPYTLLVEPGGKIVYSKQGAIGREKLRKIIF